MAISSALALVNGDTDPGASASKDLFYIKGGTLYRLPAGGGSPVALLGVATSRQVLTSGLLTGGGDLSSDRTIALASQADTTLIGRAAGAGTGVPTVLTATQAKTLLAIAAGDVSGLGALATKSAVGSADITDNSVANGDLAQAAALTLKGNNATATGNVADLTPAQVQQLLTWNWATSTRVKTASGPALTNVLTEQLAYTIQLSAAEVGQLAAGDVLHIHMFGQVTGTTVAGVDTLRIKVGPTSVAVGTALIAATSAQAGSVAGAVVHAFAIDAYLRVVATGSSGTIIGDVHGSGAHFQSAGSANALAPVTTPVAFDTTSGKDILLSITQSSANITAGNVHGAYIRRVA